ncbi:DUF6194 family protein [Sorangium sp. So ce363]|uniref:DUF6194 family protein n=1 Tax=Sorangium sp. So ce363 TaxID=3133304 RepID=UPI003F622E58
MTSPPSIDCCRTPWLHRSPVVCVLNPSDATFEAARPLLAEAYQQAVSRYAKLDGLAEPRKAMR